MVRLLYLRRSALSAVPPCDGMDGGTSPPCTYNVGMTDQQPSSVVIVDGVTLHLARPVASLLEEDEARALGLAEERAACEQAGLEFRSLPIQDHGLPADVAALAAKGVTVTSDCP